MKHVALSLLPFLAIQVGCGDDDTGSDTYYCIAEGTLVHTPDGLRPIESLDENELVLAVDPSTGEAVPARIVAVRSAERECLQLRLPGGGALVCTGDHPLYDPDAEVYAPATDWVDGRRRRVAMLVEGRLTTVEVEGHETYVGVRRVFDISVEGEPHNFVASGCLVHNKSVFYCDTSYGYNEQGECVMLSSTGIADTTGGDASADSTTGEPTGTTAGSSGSDSGSTGTGGSDSGSSGGSTGGTGSTSG